jgi:hypothetical protein
VQQHCCHKLMKIEMTATNRSIAFLPSPPIRTSKLLNPFTISSLALHFRLVNNNIIVFVLAMLTTVSVIF